MVLMASMIEELPKISSPQDRNTKRLTYQRMVFPTPAMKGESPQSLEDTRASAGCWINAYVCRESKEGNPGLMPSIQRRYLLG
jgi:hypothetical protein